MKKSLRNLLLALSAGAMIGAGSCNSKIKSSEPMVQTENPKEIYAVLANGAGSSQPERYSQSNFVYSALNVLSTYKMLKSQGVDDAHITLLMYNPANINFFETKEYKSLIEKKAFAKVLPTKQDVIEIDGNATKDNFLGSIKNLPSDSNDSIYIAFSIPAPKKQEGTMNIRYGNRNPYVEFDKETIFSSELDGAIRTPQYEKMIILQNSGDAAMLLPHMNKGWISQSNYLSSSEKKFTRLKKVLGIVSPNTEELGNELFTMNFISEYIKDKNQSLESIMKKLSSLSPKLYYFNEGKRAPEECPWFYSPFIN